MAFTAMMRCRLMLLMTPPFLRRSGGYLIRGGRRECQVRRASHGPRILTDSVGTNHKLHSYWLRSRGYPAVPMDHTGGAANLPKPKLAPLFSWGITTPKQA